MDFEVNHDLFLGKFVEEKSWGWNSLHWFWTGVFGPARLNECSYEFLLLPLPTSNNLRKSMEGTRKRERERVNVDPINGCLSYSHSLTKWVQVLIVSFPIFCVFYWPQNFQVYFFCMLGLTDLQLLLQVPINQKPKTGFSSITPIFLLKGDRGNFFSG